MSFSTLLGTIGVSLLLVAYFLSVFKILSPQRPVYILLNIIGAGISCYSSFIIRFVPFVVLEAAWCLVSIVALLKRPNHPDDASQLLNS